MAHLGGLSALASRAGSREPGSNSVEQLHTSDTTGIYQGEARLIVASPVALG